MAIYMWREPSLIKDTLVSSYTREVTNYRYRFWVCFTANNNCKIEGITLLWPNTSWNLRIAQWTNANATTNKVDYSITTWWEFTLTTPYELTANTDYVIVCNAWDMWYYDWDVWFPKVWTNVTFKYATAGSSPSTQYTNMVFNVWAITTL